MKHCENIVQPGQRLGLYIVIMSIVYLSILKYTLINLTMDRVIHRATVRPEIYKGPAAIFRRRIGEITMQRKILLDGLFLEDPEAKAKIDHINACAVATVNVCQDLDVNEFICVIGTMLDQYDVNHDLSWSDTTEAYSYLIQIREAVAAISEPLTKTV